jgi:hypothetical protein
LGLVSVIVKVLLSPRLIELGVKAFATVGGVITVSVPTAALAVPAFVVVTFPVLLLYTPPVALEVFTVTLHELFAVTIPLENATEVPFAAAETLPPPQL